MGFINGLGLFVVHNVILSLSFALILVGACWLAAYLKSS